MLTSELTPITEELDASNTAMRQNYNGWREIQENNFSA